MACCLAPVQCNQSYACLLWWLQDADLILLGLLTREPHFRILREVTSLEAHITETGADVNSATWSAVSHALKCGPRKVAVPYKAPLKGLHGAVACCADVHAAHSLLKAFVAEMGADVLFDSDSIFSWTMVFPDHVGDHQVCSAPRPCLGLSLLHRTGKRPGIAAGRQTAVPAACAE